MTHGRYGYKRGCRCPECREAEAVYQRSRPPRPRTAYAEAHAPEERPERRNPVWEPQPWRADAACRGTDPAMFFPDRGDAHAIRAARQVCMGCPVRARCLADNLHEKAGVWGGTTEGDRRRMRNDVARLFIRLAAELEQVAS